MSLSLLFFSISWLSNPGYLYKKPGSNLLKIIEKGIDCSGICPECEIVKPLRSRHCDVCNRCVGVYDHHCPWINNCVGFYNRKFFILMLFYAVTTSFIVFWGTLIQLLDYAENIMVLIIIFSCFYLFFRKVFVIFCLFLFCFLE